jgi:hypothetical protein
MQIFIFAKKKPSYPEQFDIHMQIIPAVPSSKS